MDEHSARWQQLLISSEAAANVRGAGGEALTKGAAVAGGVIVAPCINTEQPSYGIASPCTMASVQAIRRHTT